MNKKLPIGAEELKLAADTLRRYKQGKSALENRMVEDELWWELRHWEAMEPAPSAPKPTSAWLVNAVMNKHADAMDQYPETTVLPREPSDENTAKTLSEVLPVILEYNGFEQVWSDNWWEKLKHGTACYGIFWNPKKDNGLGDIEIRALDLLRVFWEPGISHIQDSRNLFITALTDRDLLEAEYPQFAGQFREEPGFLPRYRSHDNPDPTGKCLVVDWYYRKNGAVHYAKFVGDCLLYASENDPDWADGWYAHGKYPVVFDCLYPEKNSPAGYGLVALCRDPQMYIDRLSALILENAQDAANRRYFIGSNTGVNEEEFLDRTKKLIHVEGGIEDRNLREVSYEQLGGVYLSVLNMKIDELKDTAGNRDVNTGGTASGVTAAAAIVAMQEAGSKLSRDMIGASYRAFVEVAQICLELMGQFYTVSRTFRITGQNGMEFRAMDGGALGVQNGLRKPVFDIKVRAQRRNPFNLLEQNERAKELYRAGFFDPRRAQEALMALEMMEFEGVDRVRRAVAQGQTLLNTVEGLSGQLETLTGALEGRAGSMEGRAGGRSIGEAVTEAMGQA